MGAFDVTTGELVSTYSSLSDPKIDLIPNILYKRSVILDIFTKKQKKAQERKDMAKSGLSMPTFDDFERKIFVDNANARTFTESTQDIWVRDKDSIKPTETDGGLVGKIYPAYINISLSTTRTRMIMLKQLVRQGNLKGSEDLIDSDLNKSKADLQFGLSWAAYNGLGGDTGIDTAYDAYVSYPLTCWGESLAKPTRRMIDGLYTMALNPHSSVANLWGINTTTNVFLKPNVFDFYTAKAGMPLGYANLSGVTALFSKASELMNSAANYTTTLGVPAIIDIIKRALSVMKARGKWVDLMITSRDMYDMIDRAMMATEWGKNYPNKPVEDLVEFGYREQIVISGVPIIPDDTAQDTKDQVAGTTRAFPANTIIGVTLSDLDFEVHKDYNFATSEWKKWEGKVEEFYKEVNAVVRFRMKRRDTGFVIKFPAINYEA